MKGLHLGMRCTVELSAYYFSSDHCLLDTPIFRVPGSIRESLVHKTDLSPCEMAMVCVGLSRQTFSIESCPGRKRQLF